MNPLHKIDPSWSPILHLLQEEPLLSHSKDVLPNISYQPSSENIFNVFSMAVEDIKVVILGQDPYPTPGQATGYAFQKRGRPIPASLQVIKDELDSQGFGGDLDFNSWIDQGVFLLNTALTVETGNAGSHLKVWKDFTSRVVSYISSKNPCIWMLWGNKAQQQLMYILNRLDASNYSLDNMSDIPSDPQMNYVLKCGHPASGTYPGTTSKYKGNNHFLIANQILINNKRTEISW